MTLTTISASALTKPALPEFLNSLSRQPVALVSSVKATAFVALLGCGTLFTQTAHAYERIVVLSPDVADIVVAVGGAHKVVGKNALNKNPALRNAKPVGMHRNVTAESVLSVKPDLVLGSYMVQPSSIYQRLNGLHIKAVNVAPNEGVNTFANSIKQVGGYVGQPSKANRLAANWTRNMAVKPATKTRYILSYDGRIVAGKGTVGDELIRRAGGINAANVTGLKPLSREGWLAAKPDVIIIADHNKPVIGSVAKFRQRPEVAISPAGKNNKIYFWPANDFLRYGLDSPQVVNKMYRLSSAK